MNDPLGRSPFGRIFDAKVFKKVTGKADLEGKSGRIQKNKKRKPLFTSDLRFSAIRERVDGI